MRHNPTREQVRIRMEQMRAEEKARNEAKVKRLSAEEMERRAKRYVAVRKHRMAEMVQATRKKLEMLEREARGYGLDHLFGDVA